MEAGHTLRDCTCNKWRPTPRTMDQERKAENCKEASICCLCLLYANIGIKGNARIARGFVVGTGSCYNDSGPPQIGCRGAIG